MTEEYEYSPHLERLLQKGKGGGPKQRRIMELNPKHPLIMRLHDSFASNGEEGVVGDSIELLFELALVVEGSEVADPARLNRLTLELYLPNVTRTGQPLVERNDVSAGN